LAVMPKKVKKPTPGTGANASRVQTQGKSQVPDTRPRGPSAQKNDKNRHGGAKCPPECLLHPTFSEFRKAGSALHEKAIALDMTVSGLSKSFEQYSEQKCTFEINGEVRAAFLEFKKAEQLWRTFRDSYKASMEHKDSNPAANQRQGDETAPKATGNPEPEGGAPMDTEVNSEAVNPQAAVDNESRRLSQLDGSELLLEMTKKRKRDDSSEPSSDGGPSG